jgi:lipid-A-disaccharide synthase
LPDLRRRIHRVADAAIAFKPDVLVLVDAPDFTHRVARRVRKALPGVPVVNYVSPTVWAWRPGRAKAMAAYVDHVLALLPFEPEAHQRLGGPACTYVGHPVVERLPWLRDLDINELATRLGLDGTRKTLVVLPGSRRSEVANLMPVFGDVIHSLEREHGPLNLVLPRVHSVAEQIKVGLSHWPRQPHVVDGEADKFAAFRLASASLAASGTVTLEVAAAGSPMVVGYIAKGLTAMLRPLLRTSTVVLANLVLGENAFPEFIQRDCTAEKLTAALSPLMTDTPERRAQLAALARLPTMLAPPASSPSAAAADVVLAAARSRKR